MTREHGRSNGQLKSHLWIVRIDWAGWCPGTPIPSQSQTWELSGAGQYPALMCRESP